MKKFVIIGACGFLVLIVGMIILCHPNSKQQPVCRLTERTPYTMHISKKAKFKGIDVSHHNNLKKIDDVQADFMLAKATEGTTIQDAKFLKYYKAARKKHIVFGAYHFMSTMTPAETQFRNYKKVVKGKMDLIPIIDIEGNNGKVSGCKLKKLVRKFADLCIKEWGRSPILYTTEYWYKKYFSVGFEDCPFWSGDLKVSCLTPHIIKQVDKKSIKGFVGNIDYDEMYCEIDDLKLR